MENLIDQVMKTDLMKSLVSELSESQKKDFDIWIRENLSPLNELACIIKDMSSTEESSEKLAEAVHNVLSPQGSEEVSKWLEKS